MGGSTSKRSLLQKHGQLLTEEEKEAIFSCFIAITSDQEAEGFSVDQLASYLQTVSITASNELVTAIYNALRVQCPKQNTEQNARHVSFTAFVQNVSWVLKGSSEQKSYFFLSMVDMSLNTLELVLINTFECILNSPKSLTHLPEIHHWTSNSSSLRALVSHLTQPLRQNASNIEHLTETEIEQWLLSTPIPLHLLQIVVSLSFLSHHISDIQTYMGSKECPDQLLIPAKIVHPILKEEFNSTLLNHATAVFLNASIPFECRGMMYPLFSTRHHGESFSTFCKQILNRGPTLLIIRDQEGHVFGGFARDEWMFHPQFRGSGECFLFSLSPVMGIYTSSGYNSNYMYLQQNAQTLPNGLGMGGQMDYFGLWIASEFGSGHSKARPTCSTYTSPCLSGSEEFKLDVLEAWGIGQPQLPDPDEQTSGPSILDKDNTAKALLELAGKKQHSEGLREPEETDES